jgi:parvulin-like peptidyl-prolyl isomerase
MKKIGFKTFPLLLAALICLALGGCSTDSMDIVVGQVGQENVTARDVTLYANYSLLNYGYSRSDVTAENIASLNETALEYAIVHKLVLQKAAKLGLYPLSAENQKKADDSAEQYLAELSSSGGDLASAGLSTGDLKTIMTFFTVSDALMAATTKDVAVTEEEIQTEYDRILSYQQTDYSDDPTAYETALSEGTTIIVYRPEGFRYVKHILIAMPEDIAAQISTAASSGDTETVEALREQGLPLIEAKANEVLAKVRNGDAFDALIAEYGQDPGMKTEPYKSQGYQIGAKSSFVPEFLQASMGLASVGDATGLVATDYGYHIIKYASTAPSGAIPLDEVKDSIRSSLLIVRQNEAYNVLLEQWKKETTIKKNLQKMPS